MSVKKLYAVLLIFAVFNLEALAKNYKNHKVVSFIIENENQLKEIQALEREQGVKD